MARVRGEVFSLWQNLFCGRRHVHAHNHDQFACCDIVLSEGPSVQARVTLAGRMLPTDTPPPLVSRVYAIICLRAVAC